jgi:hypothetical protein
VGNRLPADILLRRIPGRFTDPYLAIAHYAAELGLGTPSPAGSLEQLFWQEETLLDGNWVVPICHVPMIYGLSARVRNWPSPGSPPWRFENVWMKDG